MAALPLAPLPASVTVNCSVTLQLADTKAATIAAAFALLLAHSVPASAITQLAGVGLTATWQETR